jgi:DNA-binding NarL/FixJ family response regulator
VALVVAAHPQVRRSLVRRLLALGARDVHEAGSVAEARLHMASDVVATMCVIDAALPDGSGVGLLAELRRAGCPHGMVLSAVDDPYSVRAALAAGVRAFLVSSAATPPMTGGVPGRSAGVTPVRLRGAGVGPEGLSAREVEVLQLVSGGRSNRAIGMELGLSALTVKSHLARIARKMGTGDRAEMVALVLRAGVIA